MKKILILMSLLLALSGCLSKKIAWEDVSARYDEIYNEAISEAAAYDSYSISDFKNLFAAVSEKVAAIKEGVKEEDEEALHSLYKSNILLQSLSAQSNSLESSKINTLTMAIESLIKAAYERSDDFKNLKQDVENQIAEIQAWSDDNWALVEKKKKIKWSEVESFYQTMEEETIAKLPYSDEISEIELEEFKNTILNNYELIKDGVLDENRKNADVIYEAAVSLLHYTEGLEGEAAEKVHEFAKQAIEYVKTMYGEKIDDPAYNFPKLAGDASKWTLSLWNELIKLLNL